jgi:hypothetical protein
MQSEVHRRYGGDAAGGPSFAHFVLRKGWIPEVCVVAFLSLLAQFRTSQPMACAVGWILSPLRGWDRIGHFVAYICKLQQGTHGD